MVLNQLPQMENTLSSSLARKATAWLVLLSFLTLAHLMVVKMLGYIEFWSVLPRSGASSWPSWIWGALAASALSLLLLLIRLGVHQIRREEQLKLAFEKQLSKVEMRALRSQMNPHFIFNCLNSIDYYILKNETEKASDYLNRFSRLIRLILQNSRTHQVNLKDELEALKLYIEMESLRFQGHFFYAIKVQKGLTPVNYEIPPMLLQPYVENAIWHGLLHSDRPGRLDIVLSLEEKNLICHITDNGIGRDVSQQLNGQSSLKTWSMGTKITEDRLALFEKLYDNEATVNIIDLRDTTGQACGTRVELSIPLQ